jgi:putative glutamine amidotransferase
MTQQLRPVIGINCDYIPATRNTGAYLTLHAGYAEKIYEAGGLPWIIPPGLKEPDLESLLERLDGVLLTGSRASLDPKRMGLEPHPAVTPMPPRREDADRLLCRLVMERQLPVLAVAVGMHTLNVVAGGSLYLHLPEDLPRALPHRDTSEGPHRHLILLEPKTRLEAIYGNAELYVNSYHLQAVQQVAAGFKVSARAPDGVIEAIEAEDPDWWAVGVQWHPHSETASKLDGQLFEAFVAAAGRREAALQLAA